jgi:hypothetical protein
MTTGRINQVTSICDADAAAHPSERRATAGRQAIVFERRWCEDEHDSTPPTSTASMKHVLSCQQPSDARALVSRSRRPYRRQHREPAAADCSATAGTTVILRGDYRKNRGTNTDIRSEARQGQPGQEVRRREQNRAAARCGRGPPFATMPITTHMPPRHGHTPLQTPDFDLRRRKGRPEKRRGIKRRGARPAAAHGQTLAGQFNRVSTAAHRTKTNTKPEARPANRNGREAGDQEGGSTKLTATA